jgi:type II secretory pathway component GspD/PulD (secretin)
MSGTTSRFRRSRQGAALAALIVAPVLGMSTNNSFAAQQNAVQPAAPRRVSLDFVQTDVHTVAKALSIQSRANVVVMPAVKGTVTVRLTDVTVDEALKRVATAIGADVRLLDGTYYLGTPAELRAMSAQSGTRATLTVKNLSAADMKELLMAALPYVDVQTVGQSRVLIVSGTQGDVAAALRIAGDADVAPPAVPVVPPVPPLPVRETYPLKVARPAEVAETIRKVFPGVKVNEAGGTVVVEALPAQQAEIAKLLAGMDVEGARGKIVRVVTLKFLHPQQVASALKGVFPNLSVQAGLEPYAPPAARFKPLSVDAQAGFNTGGGEETAQGGGAGGAGGAAGAGGVTTLGGPGSRARTVVLMGTEEDVAAASEVITDSDVAPPQVSIEARVMDVSSSRVEALGVTYDWSPLRFEEARGGRGAFNVGRIGRAPFGFDITVDAQRTDADIKELARPNVSVIDGEEASIFIGDILRFERAESSSLGQTTFNIETIPVGVALLCRPRVNGDGKITLKVHPVVSSVTGFVGRNNDIPITASREADTTMMMNDGDTIAIGGLMRDEDLKSIRSVPILSKLPFFGNLFKHRSVTKRKSEVTIFLTAKILKPS